MFAAVTDHVFIDGGHTVDFTNKAFEVLDHLGLGRPRPRCCRRSSRRPRPRVAARSRVRGATPYDLTALLARPRRPRSRTACAEGGPTRRASTTTAGVAELAWSLLSEDPAEVVTAHRRRHRRPVRRPRSSAGRSPTPRRCGSPASTRRTTTATGTRCTTRSPPRNALHQAARAGADARAAARRVPQRAARLPRPLPQHPRGAAPGAAGRRATGADLGDLRALLGPGGTRRRSRRPSSTATCAAAAIPAPAIAALGHALLTEDAEFHWFQTYEAAVRQFHAWPAGSEEQAR